MKSRFRFLTVLFILQSCFINAQFISAEIQINGLVSSSSSFAAYKAIQTLDFVDSLTIDLNTTTAFIIFDTTKKANFKLIAEKIIDAGFSIGKCTGVCIVNSILVSDSNCMEFKGDNYKIIMPNNKLLNGKKTFLFIDKRYMSKKEFYKWQLEHPNEALCEASSEFNGDKYMISILP
jgi:hypothetical protein